MAYLFEDPNVSRERLVSVEQAAKLIAHVVDRISNSFLLLLRFTNRFLALALLFRFLDTLSSSSSFDITNYANVQSCSKKIKLFGV